jgi:hypothetical protein
MSIPVSNLVPNNTTAVLVSSRAGCVTKIECFNNSTTGGYLKLYDSPPGTTPSGSSTPFVRIYVPPDGVELTYCDHLQFYQGLWYRFTTGIADNDNTAPAASQFVVNIYT